jgi:hypothetical protein
LATGFLIAEWPTHHRPLRGQPASMKFGKARIIPTVRG